MIIGIGIDVVDVPRFRESLGDGAVAGLFLAGEIDYCESRARPWECFAARAAAKRALARAVRAHGELARGEFTRQVELVRGDAGDVELRLSGAALEAVEALGASGWRVSIAHTKNTALAVVVLESAD